jgi:hypothetical protein
MNGLPVVVREAEPGKQVFRILKLHWIHQVVSVPVVSLCCNACPYYPQIDSTVGYSIVVVVVVVVVVRLIATCIVKSPVISIHHDDSAVPCPLYYDSYHLRIESMQFGQNRKGESLRRLLA